MTELMVGFSGLVIGIGAGSGWYGRLRRAAPSRTRASKRVRLLLIGLPMALLLSLWRVLAVAAAREVRESTVYTLLFLVLGAVWLAVTVRSLEWLGISALDDAIERENVAAGIAVAGALCGAMIIFAFANVGEGASIWTTLGPAALGLVACNGLWLLYQSLAGGADAIAIERDLSSGFRFAAMALGTGMFVGPPLAGDYVSAAATLDDFARGAWPAPPLVLIAALLQRRAFRGAGR